ncbi:MAG TPA: phosphoribosylanthranilate isomerase [Vicinamibacterales bacterium]|nr:phosphoribosylanthranilate isomerase [Vicinamibacterales bacterium]
MTPRVKICGITRGDDAQLAAELGASALGFVFWPQSPRFVEPDRARDIIASLPPAVIPIGVFVDQPATHVREIATRVGLGAVQLHGHESVEYAVALMEPVIKAVAVGEAFTAAALDTIPDAITVLLDAHDPVRRGGTGRTIDWTLAAEAAARRPVVLSGGLNPDNVRDAVRAVRPYAIDLSSGVESSPGVKDHDRLRALFEVLKTARPEGRAYNHMSQTGHPI